MSGDRFPERLWLALLAAGAAVPYSRVLPWLAEHGPDPRRAVRELTASPIGSFFGWDVVLTAGTVLAVAATDEELRPGQRAAVAAGALAGPSVGLPLHLWLRARNRRGRRRGAVDG
jgi:hypothetical protein